MKSNVLKKIIAVSAVYALAFSIVSAQTAPNAEVDPATGDLILNKGTPEEVVIPKPDGSIVDGDLVVGGVTIPAPNGSVQGDGSLYLPDTGETLAVPNLPVPLFFTIFGSDAGPWLFNDIIKVFYNVGTSNPAGNGWIWWEDWGIQDPNKGIFYVNTRTSEENMWAYSAYHQSWVYFYVGVNGFHRLTMQGDDKWQGSVSYYVQSPAAGMKNWHIFHADATQVLSGQVPSNGGSIVWTKLR